MKKIILILFIFMSLIGYSQRYTTIVKIPVSHSTFISEQSQSTIGFDIGGINNETNIYTTLDYCFAVNKYSPSYFNIGTGYFFRPNIYTIGLLGLYINNYSTKVNINYGGEVGYIFNKNDTNNSIVLSAFVTNNTFGIKIGLTFININ